MSNCWICLDEIKKQVTWTCPECKVIAHKSCLVEYLLSYDFNRIFCGSCKRVFTNHELRELLKKKDYKVYLNKSINASMEYFMTSNMARVNETIYYKRLFNSLTLQNKRFVTNVGRILFALRSDVNTNIDESDELSKALLVVMKSNIDISSIKPLPNPEYIRKVVVDDPIIKMFIDMPFYLGRFLFYNNTYTQAIALANEHDKRSNSPVKVYKPLPFMNCSVCGGLVVKFHHRAYCSSCQRLFCKSCGEHLSDKVSQEASIEEGSALSVDDDVVDDEHVCNEEDIKSFKSILKVTKPCPKCGVRIQKSEGCSQMFCTHCHTGFDWVTGNIITANFHNPHRTEWINQLRKEGQAISNNITLEDVLNPYGRCDATIIMTLHNNSISQHILHWCSFLSAINDEISVPQEHLDIEFEAKCVKWLLYNKSLKTIIKSRSSSIYAYGLLHDRIQTFIETSIRVYMGYDLSTNLEKHDRDLLVLQMFKAFIEDLVDASMDCGKAPIFNGLLHINHFHTYIRNWYQYLPLESTEKELPMITFSQISTNQGTLHDYMMRSII